MEPIRDFNQLTDHLKTLKQRKRVVVVCPHDDHSEFAITKALEEGFAEFILVGDTALIKKFPSYVKHQKYVRIVHREDVDEAAREGVRIARNGEADVLMKGIINTDNLLRAVLDKECGLLPAGKVLTHLSLMQIPTYHKLLFFSDAAVIPRPTLQQRIEMVKYAIDTCHDFGIEQPRISLIHCTEKVSSKFPHSLDYVNIVELAEAGEFGNVIIDGPLDVKTSCDRESAQIKGIASSLEGDADVLIFPNIESANVFYKTVSLFANGEMAGALKGTICPVVVTSRSDSGLSKFYSLAMACLSTK